MVLLASAAALPLLALAAAFAPAFAQEADPTASGADSSGGGPPGLPAPTDTLLPRTGVDTTDSDLRNHLLSAFGGEPAASGGGGGGAAAQQQLGLHLFKQIGVSETYTDNAGYVVGVARDAGDDFITEIQPALHLIDNTQRVMIDLNYAPTGMIYARNSGFSQFEEDFKGDILVTAVPDWLYVDVRGSVSQQSIFGGLGPTTTVQLSPDERQTVSSVSISPYITHTFGTAGTLAAGVGYSYSATDAPNSLNNGTAIIDGGYGLGDYGSSYLNTERAFASYTTGEDLGRFRNRIGTDDSLYQGSGALVNAHRYLVTDDASYAVTRLVSVLGEIGYEDLSYPAADFAYRGPIGSGGVELTPGHNSYLLVEYRYLDGFGAAFVQGSMQVTPRIRVFGGYSEGISTYQQDVQTSLLADDTQLTGVQATALSASPLLQTSNFYGGNQNLSRIRRLDVSATYIGGRDTATLSFDDERSTPIGRQVGDLVPISTSGWFVSASDRHEITPTLSASVYVQYGVNRSGLAFEGSGDTLSFSASLDKIFTPTLSGYLRVGGTYVVGGNPYAAAGYEGLSGEETSVTVGAVKKF